MDRLNKKCVQEKRERENVLNKIHLDNVLNKMTDNYTIKPEVILRIREGSNGRRVGGISQYSLP